jgi:hypothetical protein
MAAKGKIRQALDKLQGKKAVAEPVSVEQETDVAAPSKVEAESQPQSPAEVKPLEPQQSGPECSSPQASASQALADLRAAVESCQAALAHLPPLYRGRLERVIALVRKM